MRKLAIVLALATAACAPTIRYGLKRCPTAYASAADFTATAALLGLGLLAHNADRDTRAVTLIGVAGIVAVSSNVAECKRVWP